MQCYKFNIENQNIKKYQIKFTFIFPSNVTICHAEFLTVKNNNNKKREDLCYHLSLKEKQKQISICQKEGQCVRIKL